MGRFAAVGLCGRRENEGEIYARGVGREKEGCDLGNTAEGPRISHLKCVARGLLARSRT